MSTPLAPTTHHPTAGQRSRRIAIFVAIAAAVVAVLALWRADRGEERQAIEQLSGQERRALYERTLNTLRTSCDPKTLPQGLDDFCREQAEFVVQFPECDDVCRSLAKPHQRKPTK